MKSTGTWYQRLDEAIEHVLFDMIFATRTRSLAVLAGASLAAWALLGGTPAETPEPVASPLSGELVREYLGERPWLDEIPINPTPDNPVHAYFFMKDDRQGIYVTFLSRYRQEMELFYYKLRGTDQIEIYLPDSKKKAVGSIDVSETSKGQFDLKLHLGNDPKSGGAADYYSFKQWDKQDVAEAVKALQEKMQE